MKAGLSIPGYELLDIVGEGGMATVWKGMHTALDRLVAVKVMHHRMSQNADDYERFLQEIRAIAQINHPNVIRAYDAGELDQIPFYIMEFVSGCTVGQLMEAQGPLCEKDALFVVECLAGALDYCWQHHQLIHCDIKPDNIMIDNAGTVKLADLGLARVLDRSHYETEDDMTLGTPPYMSPEQSLAEEDLDARTDMYALGATLYHMLTGHFPFEGRSDEETLQGQLQDHIPDPLEHNPDLSNGVAWLIEKLLVKDRRERYADWKQVKDDIREVKNGRMIRSLPPRAGASTVSRHPGRKALLPVRPPRQHSLPRSPGRMNTASSPLHAGPRPDGLPPNQDLGRALLYLMAALILVVGLYGFTLVWRPAVPAGGGTPAITE